MADWLPDPAAPDVLALDARLGPLTSLVPRLSALPVDQLLVYLVDQVDARWLPALAQQFHLGALEGWALARDAAAQRALIKRAIPWQQKKGTPWALREVLRQHGLAVEIIEQADQRRIYAALLPQRLDARWRLSSAVRLRALDRQTYIPQIEHWAQFVARINLADALESGQLPLMQALVREWTPLSRHPIWQLWLALHAPHLLAASAAVRATLHSSRLHPWGNRSLSTYPDALWRLGTDGAALRLPQPFGFALGRLHGARPGARLHGTRVGHGVRAQLPLAQASAWRPERLPLQLAPAVTPPTTLFKRPRRLDGRWRLSSARLRAGQRLRPGGLRLAAQTLHECPRLDGRWPLGAVTHPAAPVHLRLSPHWRVGGARTPTLSITRIQP
ncbi:MAG: phage tail protein [Pseudomonadota bacterium]|jgi:hypothetical protein